MQATRVHLQVVAIGSALIAATYLVAAFELPFGHPPGTGSGAIPRLLGAVWLALSLLLIVEGRARTGPAPAFGTWPTGEALGRVVGLASATAAYVATVAWLGHLGAGALLVLAIIRLLGGTWRRAAAAGVAVALLSWLVFDLLLQVPLPEGIWRDLVLGIQ